jgi:hypothetical protein
MDTLRDYTPLFVIFAVGVALIASIIIVGPAPY